MFSLIRSHTPGTRLLIQHTIGMAAHTSRRFPTETDKKNKRPLCAGIGRALLSAPARCSSQPQRLSARRSAVWTCHAGEVRLKLQGLSGAKASARAVLEGKTSNGIAKAQRREISLCSAHVAYETEVSCPPVAWGGRRDHLYQPKPTSPQKSEKLYATHPLLQSLRQFYSYYGDECAVKCPTGSGKRLTPLPAVTTAAAGRGQRPPGLCEWRCPRLSKRVAELPRTHKAAQDLREREGPALTLPSGTVRCARRVPVSH